MSKQTITVDTRNVVLEYTRKEGAMIRYALEQALEIEVTSDWPRKATITFLRKALRQVEEQLQSKA